MLKIDFRGMGLFFGTEEVYLKNIYFFKHNFRLEYLANVGGLLGLCIGLSIVTVIELIWLTIRLLGALWTYQRLSKKPKKNVNKARAAWE